MKKDVLLMCQFFYPDYVTSAALAKDLAEDLVKKGLNVGVLCGYPKEYFEGEKVKEKEEYNGINITRVKYLHMNRKSKIGRLINFFSFFIAILFNIHVLFQYKCIIVYSSPPILPLIPCITTSISKSKFIFIALDIYPDVALLLGAINKKSSINKLMNYINKKVYKKASCIVAVGTEMKQHMINRSFTSNSEKIEVIPNWFDKYKINNAIHNMEFMELRKNWPCIVLYSGNMGNCQDIDTILHCLLRFKNNNKVIFVFTGHGNKVDYVKSFIKNNRINNAKVYGFLLKNDYSDMLNIADCCLVSLEKGVEGLGVPSKTYSYIAAGKPVLAIMSKNTDIAKMLEEYKAGATVEQGDVGGLEKLINEYIEDKEKAKQCGVNAITAFKNLHEREICTNKYFNLINTVINSDDGLEMMNENV